MTITKNPQSSRPRWVVKLCNVTTGSTKTVFRPAGLQESEAVRTACVRAGARFRFISCTREPIQ